MACSGEHEVKTFVKGVFKNLRSVIKTGSTSDDRKLPSLFPLKIDKAVIDNDYSNILDIQLTLTDVIANEMAKEMLPDHDPELQLVHKDNAVTVYATTQFNGFSVRGNYTLKGNLRVTPISGEGTFAGHIEKLVVITSFNFADKDTKEGLVKPDL